MDKLDYFFNHDNQVIEYQSQSSSASLHDKIEKPERLHEWLKSEEIESLHQRFVEKQKLSLDELRVELENLNIQFTDMEYNRLFLKINQNRDFKCDWNEFVSYLIFGFEDDDPASQKETLTLPISTQPVVKKSYHRYAVCCLSLLKIDSDSIVDDTSGSKNDEEMYEDEEQRKLKNLAVNDTPNNTGLWITASKEGEIRLWTTNLEPLRSGISKSIYLQMSTWILSVQAMSDVSIICTSSTEQELRFHDIVASTFSLRMIIRNLPHAVYCMSYSFYSNGKTNSRLVLGDYAGNVRILEFNPYLRGPFQSKPGAALIEVSWSDILKGKLPLFIVREYLNIHTELVQQTFFSIRLNSLICAAEYRNTKKYRGRCPGMILANEDEKRVFRIPLGVTTFAVDEKNNIIVTGGPDFFVRIWDVYISNEPSGILTGHSSGIVMVFVQPDEKKIYSVDYKKIIKVWDLTEFVLLQSYGDLVRLIPGETDLVYYYHSHRRVLLVGGRKLVAIQCNPRICVEITDGNTHAAPVSVVLYNSLFRNVVTCGLDSYIIVWDPWTGRRKIIMKNCHTKQEYGAVIDIEITAACFDPLEHFLLTGARDGSLKIWNYNHAVCIRNMSIKPDHEVTAVMWVVERILAVGWDQRVTEFNDKEGEEYGDSKPWPIVHTDDITCADVKLGEGVVTATYSGELIFWKLETGQPYRRYNIATPEEMILFNQRRESNDHLVLKSEEINHSHNIRISRYIRKSVSDRIRNMEKKDSKWKHLIGKHLQEVDKVGEEFSEQEQKYKQKSTISVQSVLFLQTRPMTKEHGSVFVALETGVIQMYSHHYRGGFLKQFNSIHKTGDCVLVMATDRKNRFLFTGTAFGYIKIWHIENFCVPEKDKVKVSMPMLRLQFIFLRNETFQTRARRAVRYQPDPLLVSSYRGHLKAITSIAYLNQPKIIVTGGHDCSCRLWSLGGSYLGTLGTPLPWMKLSPFEIVDEQTTNRMPPDIQKVASSTTMKVITGQQKEDSELPYQMHKEDIKMSEDEDTVRLYGKSLCTPILGKHFQLPGRRAAEQRIDLDTSASYIPVFTHLKIHEASDLIRPPTPPVIRRAANENYMDFYEQSRGRRESVKCDNLQDEDLTKRSGRSTAKGSVFFGGNSEKEEAIKK